MKKEELTKNLLDYLKEHLEKLNEDNIQQAAEKMFSIVKELEIREERETLALKGLLRTPVISKAIETAKLAPEEQKRLDIVREKKKITAEGLAEITGTNRNLESVYLNKLLRKGLVGRWREGKFTIFLPIEDAIKIKAEEMRNDSPEIDLLSEENVLRICNLIGARDTAIVRQVLIGVCR